MTDKTIVGCWVCSVCDWRLELGDKPATTFFALIHEHESTHRRPKIFVYLTSDEPGFQCAVALAEDGVAIASHLSSSLYWSEIDMGLANQTMLGAGDGHHSAYAQHYPSGYHLVNLLHATEEELQTNEEFMKALDLHTKGLSDASE